MARPSLMTRVTAALSGRPPATQVRERLAAAEAKAREAERAWRIAALAVESGEDKAIETEAEDGLRQARQAVARLEAVLMEVEAADAEEATATQRAREDAEDAAVLAAYAKLPKAAGEVQAAILAYVKAWRGLLETGDEVRRATTGMANPRGRTDLMPSNAASLALVALELTRLTPEGSKLPPGADAWAAVSEDRKTILPITDHFEALASAVRESLAHAH